LELERERASSQVQLSEWRHEVGALPEGAGNLLALLSKLQM
jgi:hypothetical protein